MKAFVYSVLILGICYLAIKDDYDKQTKLRRYVDRAGNHETREEAQLEYFGHDVESPAEHRLRINREAQRAKRRLATQHKVSNGPELRMLIGAYHEHAREQYFDDRRAGR